MRLARLLVAFGLAVPVFTGTASPTASATSDICVAVVVDFTQLSGGVHTTCATVPADSSGSKILQSAGHAVTFNPRYGDDFICAIDGKPAGGCSAVNDTHYWAYFHRAPGATTWQISSEGAGTYRPANASTEGWVYNNGSSTTPEPSNVPYGQICRPKPTPTPQPTRPPMGQPTGPPIVQPAVQSSASETASLGVPTGSLTPSARTAHSSPSGAPASAALGTADPTGAASIAEPPRAHSSGLPIGLLLGLVAGAALAVAAILRARRAR